MIFPVIAFQTLVGSCMNIVFCSLFASSYDVIGKVAIMYLTPLMKTASAMFLHFVLLYIFVWWFSRS